MSDLTTKVTHSGFLQELRRHLKNTVISGVCAFGCAAGLWLLDSTEHDSLQALDERQVVAVATYNPMNNGEFIHYQGELFCEPAQQARDTSASLIVRRRGAGSLLQEAIEAANRGEAPHETTWLEAYADELLHWIATRDTGTTEIADYSASQPEYVEINRVRSAERSPIETQQVYNASRSTLFLAPRHELYRNSTALPLTGTQLLNDLQIVPSCKEKSSGETDEDSPTKRPNLSSSMTTSPNQARESNGFRLGDADLHDAASANWLGEETKDVRLQPENTTKSPKEADIIRIDDDIVLIASADGILMLERDVEVFAWNEIRVSSQVEKSMLTNARTTKETFKYKTEWVNTQDMQVSSKFHVEAGHTNPDPAKLPLTRSRFFATTVQLGPYVLGVDVDGSSRNSTESKSPGGLTEDVRALLRHLPRKVLPVHKALLRIDTVQRSAQEYAHQWLAYAWRPSSSSFSNPHMPACIDLISNGIDEWHYLLIHPEQRCHEINYLDYADHLARPHAAVSHALRASWTGSQRLGDAATADWLADGDSVDIERLEGPSIDLAGGLLDRTPSFADIAADRPVPTGYDEPPTYEASVQQSASTSSIFSSSSSPSSSASSADAGVLTWLRERLPRTNVDGRPSGRPLSIKSDAMFAPRVGDIRVRWTAVRGPIPITLIAKQLPPLRGTFRDLESHFSANIVNFARLMRNGRLTIPAPSSTDTQQRQQLSISQRPRLVEIDLASVHPGRVALSETLQNERYRLKLLFSLAKCLAAGFTCISAFQIFKSIGSYVPQIVLTPTLLKPTNYIYSIPLAASLLATAWIGARLSRYVEKRPRWIKASLWLTGACLNLWLLQRLIRMYVISTYGPSVDLARMAWSRLF